MEIKIGEVVELKSGGPHMTVRRALSKGNIVDSALLDIGHKEGDLVCVWFVNGKRVEDYFSPHELEIVPEGLR